MSNIQQLRDRLFQTIEQLMDKDNPMDIERAQAVADVGQVIVNSAKVEVDYLTKADQLAKPTGFLDRCADTERPPAISGQSERPVAPTTIAYVGRGKG